MSETDAQHAPANCENCGTPLQGHFCHECGQSIHSPTRNFGHAVEEVFESFWHLDGRVFRTLRDLLSPGKVARDYLAGHRVRYLPPLRVFVIASVLTFFVAQFAIHIETSGHFDIDTAQSTTVRLGNVKKQMRAAQSVVEVEELRARIVGELRAAAAAAPVARNTIEASIAGVQRQADKRIEALRAEQGLNAQDVASQRAEGERLAAAPKPGSLEAADNLAEVERLRDARIARLRDEYAAQAAAIRAERGRLHAALAALPGAKAWPSEANMIVVRPPDVRRACAALLEAGLLVKSLDGTHPLLAGCLRLTVGTPAENDRVLQVLRASA